MLYELGTELVWTLVSRTTNPLSDLLGIRASCLGQGLSSMSPYDLTRPCSSRAHPMTKSAPSHLFRAHIQSLGIHQGTPLCSSAFHFNSWPTIKMGPRILSLPLWKACVALGRFYFPIWYDLLPINRT